jgi:gliding motility-associated-like protein
MNVSTSYDSLQYNDGTGIITIAPLLTDASGDYIITGLSAGSYSNFTIFLSGCSGIAVGPVVITDPNAPTPIAQIIQNPNCGNNDGIIAVTGLIALTNYDITYFDGTSTINLGSVTTDATGSYIISGLGAGSYSNFNVIAPNTCTGIDVNTVLLLDQNNIVASFVPSPQSGIVPLTVGFTNTSIGASTYTWDFGNGDNSILTDPSTIYTDIGTYNVMLIAYAGGCSDTAYIVIETFGKSTIIIPNVFTPNGDGSNDVFTVDGTNLESVEAEIFNRWGQKMYEWKHVKGYWDGRTQSGIEAPDGTYFYIISAKGIDGEEYFKKGGFSLIR